ncbi:hypothetical protein BVY02_01375 [bacterium J17]|nr:hypothetical protein BVY02_01375 [bacterium J17]
MVIFKKKSTSQVCLLTKRTFEVSGEEASAYQSFDLPLPRIHPDERLRRQLSFRNNSRFFWRDCDNGGGKIYSVYSPAVQFPVYSFEKWLEFRDKGEVYSREFVFEKPFFEQFYLLWSKTPRSPCVVRGSTGVRAAHGVHDVKNSFLIFDARDSESCFYSVGVWNSKKCIDCYLVYSSKNCYECVACRDSSSLRWSDSCIDCHDSYFLKDCESCRDCLFSVGLKNAEFCVFNEQLSEEEYQQKVKELSLSSVHGLESAKGVFARFVNEQVKGQSGGFFTQGLGLSYCVDGKGLYNCSELYKAKNCIDGCGFGGDIDNSAQFVSAGGKAKAIINCVDCFDNVSNLNYCIDCDNSRDLFACVGLSNSEYCIFNTQFAKSEYRRLRDKIVSHLKKKHIWGVAFPAVFSSFAYNHSTANSLMPLNEVQAQMLEYRWEADEDVVRPTQLLAGVEDAPGDRFSENPLSLDSIDVDNISGKIFLCEMTGSPFQYSQEEVSFYLENGIAPPQRAFNQRHSERSVRLAECAKV